MSIHDQAGPEDSGPEHPLSELEMFKQSVNGIPNGGEIVVSELPDGRRTALQKVGAVSVKQLEAAMAIGKRVPHEIAFSSGGSEHRVFSAEPGVGRVKTYYEMLEEAQRAGLRVTEQVDDPESDIRWVHAQYSDKGMVGIEILSSQRIAGLEVSEGKPLADGLPPVTNLHVAYYEGEEWAKPVGTA